MSPYVYCFWYLLVALDRLLAEDLNAYGMMILDEQNKNEKILENLHFYRYLRSANLMDRVIDYPVFRTNKQNLMLRCQISADTLCISGIAMRVMERPHNPKSMDGGRNIFSLKLRSAGQTSRCLLLVGA